MSSQLPLVQSFDQAPIAVPPWTGLGKRLESATRKALFDFEMIPKQQEEPIKIAIALSGGKDSLTLLYMLHAISGRGFPPFELVCVHVSGEFSCGASVSEKFVKNICQALQVPLIIRTSTKTLEELECYSCSRERRSLLFDAAKEAGCSIIAFGHHQDDNAETILMNLLHKGEFAGNLPKLKMHDYGITIIRPLIYVAEREIIEFAKQHNFARISCRCPVGQTSLRRKTEGLLQKLEELYPNARANIANAGLLYGSDKAARKSALEK